MTTGDDYLNPDSMLWWALYWSRAAAAKDAPPGPAPSPYLLAQFITTFAGQVDEALGKPWGTTLDERIEFFANSDIEAELREEAEEREHPSEDEAEGDV